MPPKDIYADIERRIGAMGSTRTGEERKVMDEVFDRETLLSVYRLMTTSYVDTVEFPISTGKEGNVFLAVSPDGEMLALKIYRTTTATFKRIARYIEGDSRFHGISGSKRKILHAWANKEFRNLQRYMDAGVRVPEPITSHKNLVLMEFIGDEDGPSPQLKDILLEDHDAAYDLVVSWMRTGWKEAGLVHGDLSEYNILYNAGELVLIDCGQAMLKDHPNAGELLRRDITNVNRFFRSRGVDVRTVDDIYEEIVGGTE